MTTYLMSSQAGVRHADRWINTVSHPASACSSGFHPVRSGIFVCLPYPLVRVAADAAAGGGGLDGRLCVWLVDR